MIRKGFIFTLKPGFAAEYERRHQAIWPELAATLTAHGVHNYSIFAVPGTLQVFGYVEVEDDARWTAIAATDVCRRWWSRMADIMETNPDTSPVAIPLREVFHLD